MKLEELTDQIYDTLTGLAGLDSVHPVFDTNSVQHSEVIAQSGQITLQIDGRIFRIQVDVLKDRYYFRRIAG